MAHIFKAPECFPTNFTRNFASSCQKSEKLVRFFSALCLFANSAAAPLPRACQNPTQSKQAHFVLCLGPVVRATGQSHAPMCKSMLLCVYIYISMYWPCCTLMFPMGVFSFRCSTTLLMDTVQDMAAADITSFKHQEGSGETSHALEFQVASFRLLRPQ